MTTKPEHVTAPWPTPEEITILRAALFGIPRSSQLKCPAFASHEGLLNAADVAVTLVPQLRALIATYKAGMMNPRLSMRGLVDELESLLPSLPGTERDGRGER